MPTQSILHLPTLPYEVIVIVFTGVYRTDYNNQTVSTISQLYRTVMSDMSSSNYLLAISEENLRQRDQNKETSPIITKHPPLSQKIKGCTD